MKNSEKVSSTGYWRSQFKADATAVMHFTGMNEGELLDMKMDMGKAWLTKHLQEHFFSAEQVAAMWMDKRVLQWWNLNWRQYDHYTILPILHKITEGERYNVYQDMHMNVFREDHPQNLALLEQLSGVLELLTDDFFANKRKEVSHAA